jgi:hypothetical protein
MSTRVSRRYPILFYPLSMIIGFVLGVLFLEGIFQRMPVGNAVLLTEVDEKYHIKHYKPHTTIRWSKGWNFALRTVKRSNYKEKFEYPIDAHWNKLGHYLVATAIARSNVFTKIYGKEIQLGERPLKDF